MCFKPQTDGRAPLAQWVSIPVLLSHYLFFREIPAQLCPVPDVSTPIHHRPGLSPGSWSASEVHIEIY